MSLSIVTTMYVPDLTKTYIAYGADLCYEHMHHVCLVTPCDLNATHAFTTG